MRLISMRHRLPLDVWRQQHQLCNITFASTLFPQFPPLLPQNPPPPSLRPVLQAGVAFYACVESAAPAVQ
ncbi:unnamed protein product, partial [Closterium sp. Naga37s-1]